MKSKHPHSSRSGPIKQTYRIVKYLVKKLQRDRDEERLVLQAVEGILAGRDRWHTMPVTPDPLIKPAREAKRLDKEGQTAKVIEPAEG